VLLDTKNPEWDAVVSTHILSEVIWIPLQCIQLPMIKIMIYNTSMETNIQAEPDRTSNDDLANIWPLSTLKR
jgi:hypothetical protein